MRWLADCGKEAEDTRAKKHVTQEAVPTTPVSGWLEYILPQDI